jgi:hypothetical protein
MFDHIRLQTNVLRTKNLLSAAFPEFQDHRPARSGYNAKGKKNDDSIILFLDIDILEARGPSSRPLTEKLVCRHHTRAPQRHAGPSRPQTPVETFKPVLRNETPDSPGEGRSDAHLIIQNLQGMVPQVRAPSTLKTLAAI